VLPVPLFGQKQESCSETSVSEQVESALMLGNAGRKFIGSGSTTVCLKKICKGSVINGGLQGSFQIGSSDYLLIKFLCIHAYLPIKNILLRSQQKSKGF